MPSLTAYILYFQILTESGKTDFSTFLGGALRWKGGRSRGGEIDWTNNQASTRPTRHHRACSPVPQQFLPLHVVVTLYGITVHAAMAATPGDAEFPRGRWFSHDALENILPRANSPPTNLTTIYRMYGELCIRTRFYDRLSPVQENTYYYITSRQQWAEVAHRFIQEVAQYKMISIETEQLTTNVSHAAPVIYVVCSTPSGMTAVFSLLQLAGRYGVDPHKPFEFLPSIVSSWIENPEIAILGTNIRATLGLAAVKYTSTVDTTDIFLAFSHRTVDDRRLIEIYNLQGRIDLGAQALFGKGEDFTPQEQQRYTSYYGPHAYYFRNRLQWPWWRNPVKLRQWLPSKLGYLDARHRWFLWHKGTTPFSVCHRVLLERSSITPDFLAGFSSVPEALQVLIREFVSPLSFRASRHLDPPDGEETRRRQAVRHPPSRRHEGPSSGRISAPPPRRRVLLRREQTPSTSSSSSSAASTRFSSPPRSLSLSSDSRSPAGRGSSVSSNALLDDEEDDIDIPPAVKRRRRAVVIPPPMPTWRLEEKARFPYMHSPPLSQGCTCCGETTHVFKCMNHYTCPTYNDKTTAYLCTYRWCRSPSLHVTALCPWLHRVCSACHIRGHTIHTDDCNVWTDQEWARRRDDWEAVADFGIHTARRYEDWRYGFYAHTKFSPFPFPYGSYGEMIRRPVRTVRADLHRYAAIGIWPEHTRVRKPTGFPFPDRPVNPPPQVGTTCHRCARLAALPRSRPRSASLSQLPSETGMDRSRGTCRPITSSPRQANPPSPGFGLDDTLQINIAPEERF